jgi:hypothetical protein
MSCCDGTSDASFVQYDLTLKQGSRETLTIIDERNYSGFSARAQFRESFTHTATILSLTSPSNGITISTAATVTTVVIDISATATTALSAPVRGVWDLEMFDPLDSSATISPVRGGFIIVPEVTQ